MSTIDLRVQGMTCGSCVRQVNQALTAVVDVVRVEVDVDTGLVRVEGNADSTALIAALEDAGYPAHLENNAAPMTTRKTGCGSGCGCR
ncbi:copper-binding protein [Pseudomonas sp. IC_126]|uniref:heavy-metal-associated domain-containing protein n=1 Tax=Pseudomonas sp. IC_126 TaxID=2547400 RepID=UPI00103ACC4A|nr:cation transporter [Pseudomonas sp. IC_126]TCD24016.1 copper-binding protein [Pseudomonas sp. IC_126]